MCDSPRFFRLKGIPEKDKCIDSANIYAHTVLNPVTKKSKMTPVFLDFAF